jgi:membrane protease YdiL (CAAX protease family)
MEEATEQKQLYWGPWPTVGLGCGLMAIAIFLSGIVAMAFMAVELSSHPSPDLQEVLQSLLTNGLYYSITTMAVAIGCTGMIMLFINMRHTISVREYLGLRSVSTRNILISLAVAIGLVILFDGISYTLGKPLVSEWQLALYRSSGWPLLLWLAFVIFGPIFEETLFRGFLFEGFRQSQMGVIGAIILTTVFWSLSHVQYNASGIASIFIFGIVLGVMRFRTASLWSVISMHALFNVVGMLETALYVNGMLR